MEWISVNNELPPDDEKVLVLAYGYFHSVGDPLCQKIKSVVFEGWFNRKSGWKVPYSPQGCEYRFWMHKIPEPFQMR